MARLSIARVFYSASIPVTVVIYVANLPYNVATFRIPRHEFRVTTSKLMSRVFAARVLYGIMARIFCGVSFFRRDRVFFRG